MKIPRDLLSGNYIRPRLFLCNADKEKMCLLEVSNLQGVFKFNSYSELSFEITNMYNDIITGETKTNPYFDMVEALRLVYLEGFGYFEIQGPQRIGDGIHEKKIVTAYSLEYTLSQKYLEEFFVNNGEIGDVAVNSKGEIEHIVLYNSDPNKKHLSLLHLILEKVYGWEIGNVDASLATEHRTFEIDRQSVYDFLMNDVCEQFNCYIVFDTIDNKINVYAEAITQKFIADGVTRTFTLEVPLDEIDTISIGGYKTTQYSYNPTTGVITFNSAPAENQIIEVVDGALSKWKTDVFVSFENLSQEIDINYDADNIKTVLTVTGADELDIREVNMGLPYLVDLSYYCTPEWLGEDLYYAYTQYLKDYNAKQAVYEDLTFRTNELNNEILYEQNKLTANNLSYEVELQTNITPTTTGVYFIRNGTHPNYYYTEVSLPDDYNAEQSYYLFKGEGVNITETAVTTLYEALQEYFLAYFNSEEPQAKTEAFDDCEQYFGFMQSYLDQLIKQLSDGVIPFKSQKAVIAQPYEARTSDYFVFAPVNVFLDRMWQEVGYYPLKYCYETAYKKLKTTQMEAGFGGATSPEYGRYLASTLMVATIGKAIRMRDKNITGLEDEIKILDGERRKIGESLQLDNYFKTHYPSYYEQYMTRLSAFLREDEYTDDNFALTGQETFDELYQTKRELKECGKIELDKLCKPKLQFAMTMANIYAMPEFDPIIDQFQLGNVIKVGLRPDYIMHSRLLQVNINFDNFSEFSCTFGELTHYQTQSDLHADLLAQAVSAGKSVASNASYWTKGADHANNIDLRLQRGLLDASTSIKSIDGTQSVEIDNYGIHLRKMNPETQDYDPEQGWITNNKFLYSNDAFKTVKSVFGSYNVDGQDYWGLLAEAVLAGYIQGSTIEGGTIKIGEYYDNGQKKYRFEVDDKGNVVMNAASISGYVTDGEMGAAFEQERDSIKLEVSNSLVDKVRYYGTCYAEADDSDKSVVFNDAFTPTEGTMITVKFINENSADNPLLWIGDGPNATAGMPIYAYDNALTADSKYNWTANSLVTFVYSTSGEPADASGFQDRWEIVDNNSEQIYSRITMTEESIKSEVAATYVTNDTLSGYSTTEQMNSAIDQKADSITSTVSKTYATIGQVAHYGTCSTGATVATKAVVCSGFKLYTGASIAVKFTWPNQAEGPKLNVNNTGAKNIAADGYASLAANSNYNWDANSTVSFIYDGTYWRLADSGALKRTSNLSSEIKQTAEAISLVVKENDDGTSFEVDSQAIRMAWNQSNNYIVFEDGEIKMYTSDVHDDNSTLFARYNNKGAHYYKNGGNSVGHIGTNQFQNDNSYKGLVFDLEHDAGYMCWAAKDNETDDAYTTKLIYHHKSTKYKKGLHFDCKTYTNGNLYLTDDYRFLRIANSLSPQFPYAGFDGTIKWGENGSDGFSASVTIDGWQKQFTIHNNVDIDFYSDVDMHNYSILNQSDARLKTNIQDTQVSAIELLNQIELKEFDWIANNEHENIGIIAQQLQNIIPDLVYEKSETGKLSIKITKFIPYLIKAIQEITEYVTGDIAPMSLRRGWVDPYSDSEKMEFTKLTTCVNNIEKIIEQEPTVLPTDK